MDAPTCCGVQMVQPTATVGRYRCRICRVYLPFDCVVPAPAPAVAWAPPDDPHRYGLDMDAIYRTRA